MNFNLSIAISAGLGTALVEAIFKLFLEHWLKEKYFLFTINKADRGECANILLEILSPVNNLNWDVIGSDMYTKAFHLMDRLEALNEKGYAEKIAQYTSDQMMLRFKMKSKVPSHQTGELLEDVVDMEKRIAIERSGLVDVVRKLKL